jgi:flavin reductase (DIM6/NTAB) family NADH-FMN oxidoreductase RutF
MTKVAKGPQTWIAPMPALLIGADVNGKPNFMTVAWAGIANGEPPMISLAIRPARHTLVGIREHSQFSVNVPSDSQAREVDFCGVKSGATVNKVERCKFKVFRGLLEHAPLVEECPINLECTVRQIIDLDSHCLVLGEIVETHVSDSCLDAKGSIDFAAVKPVVFLDNPTGTYYGLGAVIAKAFKVGLEM